MSVVYTYIILVPICHAATYRLCRIKTSAYFILYAAP